MTSFLCIYIGLSVLSVLLTFVLSCFESAKKQCKTILLILFIVTLVGVLFATGVLEAKYGWNRLYSTLIAAAVMGGLYLADALGKRVRNSR